MKYFVASKIILILFSAVIMIVALVFAQDARAYFLAIASLIPLFFAKDVVLLFIDLFISKKTEELYYMGGQSEKYCIGHGRGKSNYIFEDKCLCYWFFRNKNGEEKVLLFPADVPVNQNEGHPANRSRVKVTYYRLSKVVYKWEQL